MILGMSVTEDGSEALSVQEAASRAGVTEQAVRNLLAKGALTGVQVPAGKRMVWRVDAHGFEEWNQRRARRPVAVVPVDRVSEVVALERCAAAAQAMSPEAQIMRLQHQVAVLKDALRVLLDP